MSNNRARISAALAGTATTARWPGATGVLELRTAGDIRRSTDWAIFERGSVAALPALDPRVDPAATRTELAEPDDTVEGDDAVDAGSGEAPRTPTVITLD